MLCMTYCWSVAHLVHLWFLEFEGVPATQGLHSSGLLYAGEGHAPSNPFSPSLRMESKFRTCFPDGAHAPHPCGIALALQLVPDGPGLALRTQADRVQQADVDHDSSRLC